MKIRPLTMTGAFEITPAQHGDQRGLFLEWYRADLLAEHVGHRMAVAQANISVSARGVVRGIHYINVPPSQASLALSRARPPSCAPLDFLHSQPAGSP